jgi:hypothetical protein
MPSGRKEDNLDRHRKASGCIDVAGAQEGLALLCRHHGDGPGGRHAAVRPRRAHARAFHHAVGAAGGRVARGRPGSALHPRGRVAGQGHVPLFHPPGHDRAAPRRDRSTRIEGALLHGPRRHSAELASGLYLRLLPDAHAGRRCAHLRSRRHGSGVRRQRLSHGRGVLEEGQTHLRLRRPD